MRNTRNLVRWAGVIAMAASVGCKSLDVQNPNAPDATRAFADPGALAALVSGAYKTWWNTHTEFNGALLLNSMADGISASWNNWNMRYYTSEGVECPVRCGWDNNPLSSFRFQIETAWYGNNAALSSANTVLKAIRKDHVVIGSAANTKLLEAASVMLQGMSLAQLALYYDQAFLVDENTDVSTAELIRAIPFSPRIAVRRIRSTATQRSSAERSLTTSSPSRCPGSSRSPTPVNVSQSSGSSGKTMGPTGCGTSSC